MAINITTNLEPNNGQNYWLLASDYIKGGRVEKADLDALNAIPMANRKHGMLGFTQDNENEYIVDASLNWVPKEGNSGDKIAYKVTTSSPHGFVKLDVIGYDNGYKKVIANDSEEIDALGVVSQVLDANNFEITLAGRISLAGGVTYNEGVAEGSITPNTTYFLSTTLPGKLELTEPTQAGTTEKAILITLTNLVGIVKIGTGVEIVEEIEEEEDEDLTGYVVIQKDGNPVPSQLKINFLGTGWTITDDAVNGRTNVQFTPTGLGLFSGDVLNGGTGNLVTSIASKAVTNNKLADMPAFTFKANPASTSAMPQDISVTQAKQMLGIAVGAVNSLAKFNTTSTVVTSNVFDNGTSVLITYLAGTGTRMVVADSAGNISTQAIPTGGGGSGTLTSINGMTAAAQILSIGSTGLVPNWTQSGSTTNILNIPLASASGVTRGTISKAEYDIFNGKLGGTGTVNYIPKFSAANVLSNSSMTDTGSAIIAGVSDFAVYTTNVNYNLLRVVNGSGNGEIYMINYGTTGSGNYWTGLGSANTNSLYSNRPLIINSTNSIIFSGSGTAEHLRIASTGVITAANLAGTGTRMVVVSSTGVLSTQAIPTGSGTGGITSLNGLTGASQTFAASSVGTTHSITSSGSVHTLNIPNASGATVTSGTINNTQFTTFNNKIGGSGTTNCVAKFTASGTVGNSQIFDNGTNVGIGGTTATTTIKLLVNGNQSTGHHLQVYNESGSSELTLSTYGTTGQGDFWSGYTSANKSSIYTSKTLIIRSSDGLVFSGSGSAEHMRISTNGNVGFGGITPENSQGWGNAVEVYSVGSTKFTVAASGVRTGIWSHVTGYFSALPGGMIGTESNHPVSFITNGSSKMSIATSGVVTIPNLATSTTGVQLVTTDATGVLNRTYFSNNNYLLMFRNNTIIESSLNFEDNRFTLYGNTHIVSALDPSGGLSDNSIFSVYRIGPTLGGTPVFSVDGTGSTIISEVLQLNPSYITTIIPSVNGRVYRDASGFLKIKI